MLGGALKSRIGKMSKGGDVPEVNFEGLRQNLSIRIQSTKKIRAEGGVEMCPWSSMEALRHNTHGKKKEDRDALKKSHKGGGNKIQSRGGEGIRER